MKPENLEKMKQAIMDELGISEKLAEYCANVALDAVRKALIQVASKIFKDGGHESTT